MKLIKCLGAACLIAVLFCAAACEKDRNVQVFGSSQTMESDAEVQMETDTKEPETSASIYVDVCGAVANPGVVEVPRGSRVFEAIEKAGGLTTQAAVFAVNQAALLEDGQQIMVYTEEEASARIDIEGTFGGESEKGEGKVNLNQASADELMTLTGIGKAKAEDIIEYRETVGMFKSIEEIKNISGIKDAVFEKIKDKIVV